MNILGRGRKNVRRYLVDGSENIEQRGDRLTKVSLISSSVTQ